MLPGPLSCSGPFQRRDASSLHKRPRVGPGDYGLAVFHQPVGDDRSVEAVSTPHMAGSDPTDEQVALVALLRHRPTKLTSRQITAEVLEVGSTAVVWERHVPGRLGAFMLNTWTL